MFQIIHNSNLVGNIFFSFLSSDFLRTKLEEDGIKISRWLGKPVLIPWKSILCMDLSGLAISPYIKPVENKHFFLLMIEDRELMRKACTLTGQNKVWHASQNILGLTSISDASAEGTFKKLEQIAHTQSIKLDGIWIPD